MARKGVGVLLRQMLLAVGLIICAAKLSAQDFDRAEIQTVPVVDGIYMLVGPGGNIGVSAGGDGVLLVDAQYAQMNKKVLDAVAKFRSGAIRFVVNTHWHADHVSGNDLMKRAGAVVVAHENLRTRMSTQQYADRTNPPNPPSPPTIPISPKEALPTITFKDGVTLHFNGEEIQVTHLGPAHTDTDSVVHFKRANVIHTGDILSMSSFPIPDDMFGYRGGGGSLKGMISVIDQILKITTPDTKIIPGHGPLASAKELREYRDMISTVRDRIQSGIREGKTVDQVVASQPTAEFDERYRRGRISPDDYVKLVYHYLSRNGQ